MHHVLSQDFGRKRDSVRRKAPGSRSAIGFIQSRFAEAHFTKADAADYKIKTTPQSAR
jgi:hypothetical protein